MSEWPRVSVKTLCSLIVDCVNRTAPVVEQKTPFRMIRTTNVKDGRIDLSSCRHVDEDVYKRWTRRARLMDGDVVLTREAPIGEVGYIHNLGPVFLGQRLMQYRPNPKKIVPRYLYYAFRSPDLQHQFGSHDGSGSVVSHIRVADCHEFKISVPPIEHQEKVASLLGSLDDKIELNRRTNETLEAMAQAIFRDWFVDFGPTRRKLGGATDPVIIMGGLVEGEGAKGLADLFPAKLGDDGLPEGWRTGRLDDLAGVHMGASPKGDTYNEDGIGMPLANGPVEFGEYFLVRKKWTTSPTRLSQVGDYIICVRGSTTGRHVFADGVYCLGRGVAAIRGFPGQQDFVNATIDAFLDVLLQKTTGSVFPNLSGEDIRSFGCLVPPEALRRGFSSFAAPFKLRVWHNVKENQSLATSRDLLLPKLMSGEIRLSEAEDLMEAAQ